MLHCDHVSEEASALVDGDLPWWRVLRIRLHLLICESCAHFVRQIRATKALTETADRAQAGSHGAADDATLDAILARARGESRAP